MKAPAQKPSSDSPIFVWSQSISGRLLMPLVVIGLLSLLLSFVALDAHHEEETAHATELKATLLQATIEDRFSSVKTVTELNSFFQRLVSNPSIQEIHLIETKNKKVVASSNPQQENTQFNLDFPHFSQFQLAKTPSADAIERLDGDMYFHISPLATDKGENANTYTLALALNAFVAQHSGHGGFFEAYSITALTILVILITAAGAMYHAITKPLSEITTLIREGAQYIPDRLSCDRTDEIGELGRSFNRASEDQSRREQQLALAQVSAEQGARTKSDFLATISHEIRTPMNSVLGLMKLLLRTSLNDDQRGKLTMALKSADSLMVIINDILDFSKIDAGNMRAKTIDFNLIKLVQTQVALLQPKIDEKFLYLHMELDEVQHQMVHSDPRRVRQVLASIFDNSVKFTQSGGVTVSASTRVDPKNQQQILFHCKVKDTGIGIEPKQKEHLFSAFTQENTSNTREYNGTGLGLAIARELCHLLGGSISVQSEKNQGSTFEITLAFKTPSETSLGPKTNQAGPQGSQEQSLANPKYLHQLRQKFEAHSAQGTAPLQSLISQSNIQGALEWVHKLRGLAGGLGFSELKDSARKLEVTLAASPKDCSTLIAECDTLIQNASSSLTPMTMAMNRSSRN